VVSNTSWILNRPIVGDAGSKSHSCSRSSWEACVNPVDIIMWPRNATTMPRNDVVVILSTTLL